ncbi:universal stress protein [Chitinophagaceae bacterium LB-8]|uniref:Universal stress protein n=1 Tax=Paraflavisolibacter caeni TaxID=2982496 RepID=A0A9X3BIA4_9BACT|nr:universal stress protein [Paraflavisolibacter caeni]MCU7549803.1 universal stress protein [Paraflavisolibacter caeni]
MKTIVVATDFSSNADHALQYAGALASFMNARIILFNAFQLPVHASNTLLPAESFVELLKDNQERLENIALQVSDKFGVTVDVQTKMSDVSNALEEIVMGAQADLVVMGMHTSDWSDRLFGNTTTSVIRDAKYPVLVVPNNASFTGIERILYAFDSNCLQKGTQLQVVKDIARSFKAEVQVFHVETAHRAKEYTLKEPVDANTKAALNDVAHTYREIEETGVVEGIEKGIKELGANLLVMVPHKLSFWKNVVRLSTTRTVVLKSQIPLLVVPNTCRG